MFNNSFLFGSTYLSIDNEWNRPALASCYILKWIAIYLCFIFIAGVILNSFVLYNLTKKTWLHSPIDIFIIALSSSDLLQALFGIPLPLISNFACRWCFGKYLCYYEGFIAYFVGMTGLYLLTSLSLNRYWLIVGSYNTKYVTNQTAFVSVSLSIFGGLFWSIAPVFGWNDYTLEGVLTSCSIRWQDRTFNVLSYNILMFIFAYNVPLFIMIYCNLKIYLKVRCVSQRKLTWKKGKHKSQNIDKRMAKTVFFIILNFVSAWTPYAIVAFISAFISPGIISPLGGTLPAIFAKSSIYSNPLIYIITNSQIRSKIFCWKKKSFKFSESISSKEKYDQSPSVRLQLITP